MATKSKIHIKPSKRGTLRKAMGAKKGEKLSVSAMKKKMKSASPAMRKKLNFAINARKWKHEDGGPLDISNLDLTTSFAKMNNLPQSRLLDSGLAPTNNPGGKSGGLNMSFDPISLGLSTITAIGGSLGANMAAERAEMYEDASENMQTIDVNKAMKGSGVQAFLQNPLSLGIGGRKRARLEAEEFNENMKKQRFAKDVSNRFSTISQAPTYTPVARQGGFIAYKGQTHEGPDGGILVDKFGNPTAVSQGESIASVEGGGKNKKGEVSYYDPETGSTYIYSDTLKFAKPANALLNKYKLNKPESLQYQQYKNDILTKAMVDKKFENLTTAQEFAKETNSSMEDSVNIFKEGGYLSSAKAKEMLRDGKAHGKKLTAKQKRYFGWIAGGRKEEGGPLDKRTVLMPKENLEYDRDLRMNVGWMDALNKTKNIDELYNTNVGSWKGNPMTMKQFTEMPSYVTDYYNPTYAVEFNKNRLGLPNTFQDINLGKTRIDEYAPMYQPAYTVRPGNNVAYRKKGGYVPMYANGKDKTNRPFNKNFKQWILDPLYALAGADIIDGKAVLVSDRNPILFPKSKSKSVDKLTAKEIAMLPWVKEGTTPETPKKLKTIRVNSNKDTSEKSSTVSPYEVPNLEINPTQIPGVTFPSSPTLNMPSGFANISGLYDKKTNNVGPGYYNERSTRPYIFGNIKPSINKTSSVSSPRGSFNPIEPYSAPNDLMDIQPQLGSLVSEPGVDNMNLPSTHVIVGQGMNPFNNEEQANASWLNPAGHLLSATGALADYAAMRKARPENVNLGRVGAERISLAKQRLSNERNATTARAMATSAARSSGMNAGVALSNTLAANTGTNRLLGQQNAELLEREETANAQMRQQANMVNAELAAQEGLFNTQQQNAYKMMMAQNNPLGNLARTAASYFADNAAYQQGYDTLQMLAPNAELYRDPDDKFLKRTFGGPKVRLR